MNESLEKEVKLLRELNYAQDVQFQKINRVLKRSEEVEANGESK